LLSLRIRQGFKPKLPDEQSDFRVSPALRAQRLIVLALHVLSLVNSIAPNSGTHSIVTIILLVVSKELRFLHFPDSSVVLPERHRIQQARDEITSRMVTFRRIFPLKPISRIIKIMEETWRRLDTPDENVFWMDVMIEKQWETILG
jgi:hypothetical protein